jgi:hypothetical protein
VVCVGLAVVGWRRRRRSPAAPAPADEAPAPWPTATLLASPGTAPGWVTTALVAAGAAAAGLATTGPASGVALAILAVLGLRVRRAAPLLALGPAALVGLAGAYVVAVQVRREPPWGFSWPSTIDAAHPVATTAVLLLVLAVVVERLRTGSWIPDPGAASEGEEPDGRAALARQWGMSTDDPPESADR